MPMNDVSWQLQVQKRRARVGAPWRETAASCPSKLQTFAKSRNMPSSNRRGAWERDDGTSTIQNEDTRHNADAGHAKKKRKEAAWTADMTRRFGVGKAQAAPCLWFNMFIACIEDTWIRSANRHPLQQHGENECGTKQHQGHIQQHPQRRCRPPQHQRHQATSYNVLQGEEPQQRWMRQKSEF